MPLIVSSQRTDEWFSARIGRISASVSAGCLGLHPYMSRASAWRAIMGTDKKHDNKNFRWGHEYEPMARAAYEVETGNIVTETGLWQHPVHDFLIASPDGLIGDDEILEIKCPGALPEAIPIHHHLQMLVQMICTGRKFGTYFVFLPPGAGQEAQFWMQRVYLKGEAGLIRKLKAFYDAYVVPNVEPPRKKRRKKTVDAKLKAS